MAVAPAQRTRQRIYSFNEPVAAVDVSDVLVAVSDGSLSRGESSSMLREDASHFPGSFSDWDTVSTEDSDTAACCVGLHDCPAEIEYNESGGFIHTTYKSVIDPGVVAFRQSIELAIAEATDTPRHVVGVRNNCMACYGCHISTTYSLKHRCTRWICCSANECTDLDRPVIQSIA